MKKIISVALALVMLLSCCSLMALAVTTNAVLEISVEPKESKYAKGDIVTFEVFYEESKELDTLGAPTSISFGYDSSVFEPIEDLSTVKTVADTNTFIYEGYLLKDNVTPSISSAVVKKGADAVDTAKGWDSFLMFKITGDGFDSYKTKAASFAFKLKIKDDANPAGSYKVGISHYCLTSEDVYYQVVINDPLGGIYGMDTSAFEFTNPNMFSTNDATVNVGTPTPAGPTVSKAKSQVKMTATSATTVADEFSFRVISKISDSDWDTYFKNTGVAGATTDCITAVGMVAYKGAGAFDADTAKRVVAGESVADYTAATTDYISKADASADAQFGAIIKAKHSTLTNDVTYMGFVQYVDASGNAQTIFYETAGTAALSTNYDTIVSKYLAAFPFAA